MRMTFNEQELKNALLKLGIRMERIPLEPGKVVLENAYNHEVIKFGELIGVK